MHQRYATQSTEDINAPRFHLTADQGFEPVQSCGDKRDPLFELLRSQSPQR